MHKFCLPLQLLLALALVLNGIGGAMAGVLAALPGTASSAMTDMQDAGHDAMAQGHDATAGASVAGTSPMQPEPGDCRGHRATAAETEAAQATTSDCHTGEDCGDSPECRQACMHASVAVPPQLFVGVVQSPAEAILHPLASGHPAPSLRGLIRPPIA